MASAAAFSGGYVANLGPSVEGFLLPAMDADSMPFWQATKEGKLTVQACGSCGVFRHPPRPMCPRCRSTERAWKEVSGKATIWSYAVPHPPLLKPYSDLAPYNVIVVELDDHPHIRFVGNLLSGPDGAINEIDPDTIRIGEPVEVVFKRFVRADGSEEAVPMWVRADG